MTASRDHGFLERARQGQGPTGASAGLGVRGRVVLAFFALAAAYFLWTEHRVHAIQFLPWGILLLCPVMHLFMHHGHGGHGSHDSNESGGGGSTSHGP